MLNTYKTIQLHNPNEHSPNIQCCEDLKSQMKLIILEVLQLPVSSSLLASNMLLSIPFSNTFNL
jgi:hypothetical protein